MEWFERKQHPDTCASLSVVLKTWQVYSQQMQQTPKKRLPRADAVTGHKAFGAPRQLRRGCAPFPNAKFLSLPFSAPNSRPAFRGPAGGGGGQGTGKQSDSNPQLYKSAAGGTVFAPRCRYPGSDTAAHTQVRAAEAALTPTRPSDSDWARDAPTAFAPAEAAATLSPRPLSDTALARGGGEPSKNDHAQSQL